MSNDKEMQDIDNADNIEHEKPEQQTEEKAPRNIFVSMLFKLNFSAYIMEFIGTFMLTLIVALTANTINQPLAIGASCKFIY
jgi:hypothetical protein